MVIKTHNGHLTPQSRFNFLRRDARATLSANLQPTEMKSDHLRKQFQVLLENCSFPNQKGFLNSGNEEGTN